MTVQRAESVLKPATASVATEEQVEQLSLEDQCTESVSQNLPNFKFYIDLLK